MQPQILVIIADDHIRSSIQTVLSNDARHHITAVSSAHQALNMIKTSVFDVIITAIEMPGMDGWRFTRLVRSGLFQTSRDAPIVMIPSVWCQHIVETMANEFGVNAVCPVTEISSLPNTLDELLALPRVHFRKPKLLVVEDSEITAELIQRALQDRFDITHAENGEVGVEKWQAGTFDLVLLDVKMPRMNGEEVLNIIHQQDPDQTVVIMTAYGHENMAANLMLQGAADFITKPFKADALRRLCELAARRQDYLICYNQFAQQIDSVVTSQAEYRALSVAHQNLLDHIPTAIVDLNVKGQILFSNSAWNQLVGEDENACLGRSFVQYIVSEVNQSRFLSLMSMLRQDVGLSSQSQLTLVLRGAGAQLNTVNVKLRGYVEKDGAVKFTCCIEDITAQISAKQELEYQATHDNLTNVYNRCYFEQAVANVLSQQDCGVIGRHSASILCLDIDHFKLINDNVGHQQGDTVIKALCALIESQLSPSDILCRTGGDEFAIVFSAKDIFAARHFAVQLKNRIDEHRFVVDEMVLDLTCSIGIASLEASTASSEEHIANAELALYIAKQRGRNQVHLYSDEDKEGVLLKQKVDWVKKIRLAIKQKRLRFYLQPVYVSQKTEVEYYEALVRYVSHDDEIIGPAEFLPALENARESIQLDLWAIEMAFSVLQEHQFVNRIGINLSAQVFNELDFITFIESTLAIYAIDPNSVVLEITESASFQNMESAQHTILALKSLGFRFAIDDFGSGFSTFSYLKQIPADYIKLDGSFVKNIANDKLDQALVKSMVEVSTMLGRKTVAEFVEDRAGLDVLQQIGVDCVQGFYLAHPQPIANFS